MSNKEFTIREYKDSDLKGVLDLWEHHSGWGRPSINEYKKWMKTPFGECDVVVAEDKNNNIIGQMIFTPNRIIRNGNEERILKISAPIIHNDYRKNSLFHQDHPIIQMYLIGEKNAQKKGIKWFYNFPAQGWTKFLLVLGKYGLNPWNVQLYKCFEFPSIKSDLDNYSFKEFDNFGNDIEKLWEEMKKDRQEYSFFSRDIDWLKYKWGDDYKLGIYNAKQEFVGYAVIKTQSGLLLDYVTNVIDKTPYILSALSNYYNNKFENNSSLKFMESPFLNKVLMGWKVKPIDFTFAFGLCSISEKNKITELDFSNWYVFPND